MTRGVGACRIRAWTRRLARPFLLLPPLVSLTACAPSIPQKPIGSFTDMELAAYAGVLVRADHPDQAAYEAVQKEIVARGLLDVAGAARARNRTIYLGMPLIEAFAALGGPDRVVRAPWQVTGRRGSVLIFNPSITHVRETKPNEARPAAPTTTDIDDNLLFTDGHDRVIGYRVRVAADLLVANDHLFYSDLQAGMTFSVPIAPPDSWIVRDCAWPWVRDPVAISCSLE